MQFWEFRNVHDKMAAVILCCIQKRSIDIAAKEDKQVYTLPRKPVYMEGEMDYKDRLRKPGRPVILDSDATFAVFDNPAFIETPVRPRTMQNRRSPPPYHLPSPITAESIELDKTSLPSNKPSSSSDYSSLNLSESASLPSPSVESPTYRLPPPITLDVTCSSRL